MKTIRFARLVALVGLVSMVGAVPYGRTATERPGLSFETEEQDSIVQPRFLGGDAKTFTRWVNQRIRYPEALIDNNIQGHIVLQLAVDSTGAVSYVKTAKASLRYGPRSLGAKTPMPASPEQVFVNEVLRVVSLAPRWTPGLCNGKPTTMFILLPVRFELN